MHEQLIPRHAVRVVIESSMGELRAVSTKERGTGKAEEELKKE
jgi:hypothetical protein